MRLLLVEDSPRLQRSLQAGLRRAGYSLDIAGDGELGLQMALAASYDAIILDRRLPKRDGLGVLKALRAEGSDAHVLMLTAQSDVEDRVEGLEAGADDYLGKPFAFEELLARVQALCRRGHGQKSATAVIGGLEIDMARRTARRGGERIELAPREFKLLELFAMRRGETLTRAEIEACIYDERVEPMSNVVDSAICLLRKKIDPPEGPSLIRTRRGVGYLLDDKP